LIHTNIALQNLTLEDITVDSFVESYRQLVEGGSVEPKEEGVDGARGQEGVEHPLEETLGSFPPNP